MRKRKIKTHSQNFCLDKHKRIKPHRFRAHYKSSKKKNCNLKEHILIHSITSAQTNKHLTWTEWYSQQLSDHSFIHPHKIFLSNLSNFKKKNLNHAHLSIQLHQLRTKRLWRIGWIKFLLFKERRVGHRHWYHWGIKVQYAHVAQNNTNHARIMLLINHPSHF